MRPVNVSSTLPCHIGEDLIKAETLDCALMSRHSVATVSERTPGKVKGGINMRRFRFVLSSLSILAALATPVASMAQISIRIPPPITVTVPPPVTITVPPPVTVTVPPPIAITVAPPELPVYEQPALPAPGYIWTPGYWAYGSEGYFWVPGTWVQPPSSVFYGRRAIGAIRLQSNRQ